MIKKLRHIAIGWLKVLRLLPVSEAEKKLQQLRMQICGGCDQSKPVFSLQLADGEGKKVEKLYCNRCTCPCIAKAIVVNEACPLGKW